MKNYILKMWQINNKNWVYYLSSSYALYSIKALNKKPSFNLVKKKRYYKSKEKNILKWFFFFDICSIFHAVQLKKWHKFFEMVEGPNP
jgi:hypothetical protein